MRSIVAVAVALSLMSAGAFAQNKACTLATSAELESLLGAKLSEWSPMQMAPWISGCRGKAGTSSVRIRYTERHDDPTGEKEKGGLEELKKMGATVDAKKIGPFPCSSTFIRGSYVTGCRASKGQTTATIETTTKQAISMDKLAEIAQKMLARF